MIFVTVGMSEFQFNRLIKAVDEFCSQEKQEAYIQLGSSEYKPHHCQWVEFLPVKQIQLMIRNSTTVIAHAGTGSILTCIDNGRAPLVVPRLSQFGEAVDDHQVNFALWMQAHGYAHVIEPDNLTNELLNLPPTHIDDITRKKAQLIHYLDFLTMNKAS